MFCLKKSDWIKYKLPALTLLVAQLYLTLCDPKNCHPPGSSVPEILQARTQEWVAISFYKDTYYINKNKQGKTPAT